MKLAYAMMARGTNALGVNDPGNAGVARDFAFLRYGASTARDMDGEVTARSTAITPVSVVSPRFWQSYCGDGCPAAVARSALRYLQIGGRSSST